MRRIFSHIYRHIHRGRLQNLQIRRLHHHQKAAFTAIDVYGVQRQNTGFHIHRQHGFGAKRAGATHQIARPFVRLFGVGRINVLHAQIPRQLAGRDVFVTVHQHDHALLFLVFTHDGFDDMVFIHPQTFGRMGSAAALFVFIQTRLKSYVVAAQETDCLGHGESLFSHFCALLLTSVSLL